MAVGSSHFVWRRTGNQSQEIGKSFGADLFTVVFPCKSDKKTASLQCSK